MRDRLSLLHDLATHQEELAAQNQNLRDAHRELESVRDRFIELFDFAPNGYLILDANGIIRQCNLTAASLIGIGQATLEGLPLLHLVARESRAACLEFLRLCRSGAPTVESELTLETGNGAREAQLVCRPRRSTAHAGEEYLTALVDVTERNALERERARIAREHAALAALMMSVQEEERRQIALNLHDDIGQQVTAIRLRVEEALRDGGDGSVEALALIHDLVRELDRRVHFVATGLRPAALDLGVVTALAQFVQGWSSALATPADFHANGVERGDLPADVETHVYRIVQEALHNVSKHAAATHVTVLLERRPDGFVLIVEDDGRGFEPSGKGGADGGLGLVGMRERAQIIGGRLAVESTPGHGTSVFLHLPIGDRQAG